MICKCSMTPDTRGVVFQGLAVNINEVIDTHNISDKCSDVVSNELERIEDIGFRINDDFDMFRYIKGQLGASAANSGIGASQGPLPTESA